MAAQNNGLAVPWSTLISTMAFGVVLAGAGWSLFQTQFSSQAEIVKQNKEAAERMITNLRRDLEARDTDLRSEFQFLRNRLITVQNELVHEKEFKEQDRAVRDRLERLDRQLQALEVTRPTTGELQSTARALDSQVNRVEERVRQLETFIRGAPSQAAPR
jgi:hypothetical protein